MRKLTQEEFIQKAQEAHGDKYDYSKALYRGTRVKVCIICPIHGEFWQAPKEHIYQHQGCPQCGIDKRKSLVFGVGVNDYDGKLSINGKFISSYSHWIAMLCRCYNTLYKKKIPTYDGCCVCDEWLSFSNFKRWFDEHYVEGYHLDKDILVQGNKVYSPETCCFVPKYINTFLTSRGKKINSEKKGVRATISGKFEARLRVNKKDVFIGRYNSEQEAFCAYKLAKKRRIDEVATEAYAKGEITKEVRDALYRWKIKEY